MKGTLLIRQVQKRWAIEENSIPKKDELSAFDFLRAHQIYSDLKDMAGLAVPKEKVPQGGTPKEQGFSHHQG